MANKKCKYLGCITILNARNDTDYCHAHEVEGKRNPTGEEQLPTSEQASSNAQEDRPLTLKEFAKRVNYTTRRVSTFLNEGTVKGFQPVPRGKWSIPESEVARFLQGSTTSDKEQRDHVKAELHVRQAEDGQRQFVAGLQAEKQEKHDAELREAARSWIDRLRFPAAYAIPFERRTMRLGMFPPPSAASPCTSAGDPEAETKKRRFFHLIDHLIAAEKLSGEGHSEWLADCAQKEATVVGKCIQLFENIREETNELLRACFTPSLQTIFKNPLPADSLRLKRIEGTWPAFVEMMSEEWPRHPVTSALRRSSVPLRIDGGQLRLGFSSKSDKETCEEPGNRSTIVTALRSFFPDVRDFSAVRLLTGRLFGIAPTYYKSIYREVIGISREASILTGDRVLDNTHWRNAEVGQENENHTQKSANFVVPEVMKAKAACLASTFKSVVKKYSDSAEVSEIKKLDREYQKLLDGLKGDLEKIVGSHVLPGCCEACPNQQAGPGQGNGARQEPSPTMPPDGNAALPEQDVRTGTKLPPVNRLTMYVKPSANDFGANALTSSQEVLTARQRQRIIQALESFKRPLVFWMYDYAHILSGKLDNHQHMDLDCKLYIPELEDIFGLAVRHPTTGEPMRGTLNWERAFQHEVIPELVRLRLDRLNGTLQHIESQIKTFPDLLNQVSQAVANIVLLRDILGKQLTNLKKWETRQITLQKLEDEENGLEHAYHPPPLIPPLVTGSSNGEHVSIRYDLAVVGAKVLDILIAIDADIKRFESKGD